MLSEAIRDRLDAIATLARSLSETELRVLIELARRANAPEWTCKVSLKDLVAATGSSRRSVIDTIATLGKRSLITSRRAIGRDPSGFRIEALRTVQMGATTAPITGATTAPSATTAPIKGATTAPVTGSTGATTAPIDTENQQVPADPSSVDISIDPDPIINRLLKAHPSQFPAPDLVWAKQWLGTYACKFPAPSNPYPKEPDDWAAAQFLSIATRPRLEALLYELMAERKESGWNYAWFASVALQRIHGIAPAALAAARAEQKKIKSGIRAIAAGKSF